MERVPLTGAGRTKGPHDVTPRGFPSIPEWMSTTLITGATGNLGAEILARLHAERPGEVVAIVRASDDAAAQARLAEAGCGGARAIAGDIEAPLLGLSPAAHEALAADLGEVFHVAASTKFDLPLEAARRTNVEGTANVLALAARARRAGFRRFHHVSTAYVAGATNTYERTKAEGEALVR